MARSATPRNDPPLETSTPAGTALLESIPCSEDLHRRPSRPPDHEKENHALVELVSALADSPTTIFQTLVETIQDITQSDTAGLSLLTRDDNTPDPSGKLFYWPAITGMWKSHIGGGIGRDSTPCGVIIDQNRSLLFRHFQRCYPFFLTVTPAPEEALLAPFHIAGKGVGTIWAVMHSDRRKFDAEDDRVMTSLGKFASSAFQALKHIGDLKIQVAEREKAEAENIALREEINQAWMFEEIVGSSEPLWKVLTQVSKVAPSDSTVLILGETGTGKELIARAIHKRSSRSPRAFIAVNCAAIPPSLIASELFGHEKGAFTGAMQRRLGRFEMANGGTIFLDEVGDLPADIQIALLRVLQEREIERVGSSKSFPVDVRVVAATHRDLNALVSEGKFRQDLLYRLNVVPVQMPSLRERATDIPLLVEYFIARYGKKAGKKFKTIDKNSLKLLQGYEWPGNVRELQNVIERAVILSDTDTFAVDETWLRREESELRQVTNPLNGTLLQQEKDIIEAALATSHGRVAGSAGAAAKLGIPTRTLDSKIKRLGIDKYRFKSNVA